MNAGAIALWLFVFAFPASGQSPANVCVLPKSLQDKVTAKYPGAKVVTVSDLNEDDQHFFEKDHPGACPGLVKVDFYGDTRPTFALELIERDKAGPKTKLVMARQIGGEWKFVLLEETGGNPPVVWSDKPGEHQGVYGDKLRAAHSVIIWQGYESWAVLYAWNGRKIEHIQLVD
jgi:hypothetical protein